MKIHIEIVGKNILTTKDYSKINDRGEIAHFLMELELIKFDLIELWGEWCDEEESD